VSGARGRIATAPRAISWRLVIPAALTASALGALLPATLLGAFTPPEGAGRTRAKPRVSTRAPVSARPRRSRAHAAQAPSPTGAPGAEGSAVTVAVSSRDLGPPVPANFLGLSFEGEALPRVATYRRGGELDELLRSLGGGVLRFGGVSSDKSVAWLSAGDPQPSWASTTLSRRLLTRVAALVRRVGWSALLTVNLARYDPAAAAQEAAAAHTSFGSSLMGIEIGNEPNAYIKEGLRPTSWSIARWLRQLAAYGAQIARAVRGAPLALPDASSGVAPLRWVRAAAPLHPYLLTDHFYPLTSCGYLRPSIAELLAPTVRASEAAMLVRLEALMRARATALRIDETNDISCHGEPGVSNSFASALWAVDWIVRAMRARVAGLNFHDLLDEPGAYSPLVLRDGSLHANPEWYALLMAARLVGERPVAVRVSASPSLTSGGMNPVTSAPSPTSSVANLTTGAFLSAGTGPPALSVVLDDFDPPGSPPLSIRLRVPARFRVGTVLRLQGPGPAALGRVTLGGSEVDASGAWRPRLPVPSVRVAKGAFTLKLPPSSAALVTLPAN
jgi:hypothetical protein